jgi:hypothetical protein
MSGDGLINDQLFDGRKIRALTIIDTFTRLSPAIDVRQSYRGADVVATLERAAIESGLPKMIRLDNGPSSSARNWIYGPSCAASRLTSPDQANQPTTPTPSRFARCTPSRWRSSITSRSNCATLARTFNMRLPVGVPCRD